MQQVRKVLWRNHLWCQVRAPRPLVQTPRRGRPLGDRASGEMRSVSEVSAVLELRATRAKLEGRGHPWAGRERRLG